MTTVTIRPWAENDYSLLERLLGDPAMTTHIGGPETPSQIKVRHERYCTHAQKEIGGVFVAEFGPEKIPAGFVGYWEKEWQDQTVWETGWSTLPEFQGQGIATKATAEIIKLARADQLYPYLHAFPSVDNGSSNAICRKLSFSLQGQYEFEYPPGKFKITNDWRFELFNNR